MVSYSVSKAKQGGLAILSNRGPPDEFLERAKGKVSPNKRNGADVNYKKSGPPGESGPAQTNKEDATSSICIPAARSASPADDHARLSGLPVLSHYDAACRALAEAVAVDEVKDILDVAVAMRAYAKQAKNREAEANAVELRMRATRRLDALIQAQKKTVGLAKGGRPTKTGLSENPVLPTLTMQGIDKNLAHQARKLGAMTDGEFEHEVKDAREHVAYGKREIVQAAKEIRAVKMAENRAAWEARNVELSKANAPLPSDRRYPIIYADPPWHFEVYNDATGGEGAAHAHYPTMSLDDICALPVANVATPDAALFLWTTAPTLPEALKVLEAWGFVYRTHMVWVKNSPGLGYWVRNQHELLLIGARGNMRSPAEKTRPSSIIEAPKREHSRKPDETYELIEHMYPELPKIELFARNARKGWAAWGNEAPGVAA
jgi:N6-adenosine-specific RNA methylase IME4